MTMFFLFFRSFTLGSVDTTAWLGTSLDVDEGVAELADNTSAAWYNWEYDRLTALNMSYAQAVKRFNRQLRDPTEEEEKAC